jgi:hypothetical protein
VVHLFLQLLHYPPKTTNFRLVLPMLAFSFFLHLPLLEITLVEICLKLRLLPRRLLKQGA